jgi:hypothetical protein
MYVNIVQKLGLMHLAFGSKAYKIMLRVVTQALGRIIEHRMKLGMFNVLWHLWL